MYIVNTSTSIVRVPTRGITGDTIVYVSSSADQGQLVTIFDVDGFLSSPNSIFVSSSADTNFGPGISSIQLQQAYSYVTLRCENPSEWRVVDQSAFPLQNQSYTTQGIQFTTLTAKNVATLKSLTTDDLQTSTLTIQSSDFITGALFTSSIVINKYSAYLSGTNYSYFQTNSASNAGDFLAQSTMSTGQQGIFQSSFSTGGQIFIQNNLSVSGTFITYSSLTIQNFLSVSQRFLVNSNVAAKSLRVTSNIVCFKEAQTSSLIASQIQTNSVVANGVTFSQGSLQTSAGFPALFIQPSLYITGNLPAIYTSSVYTVDTVTSSLTVGSNITMPNVSTLYIPNAKISNANGVLNVSSIVSKYLQIQSLYGQNNTSFIPFVSTQTSFFSTLYCQGSLYSSTIATEYTITDICIASSISTAYLVVSGTDALRVTNLVGSLNVSSAFLADEFFYDV